ncbi:MAG: hypothetical protein F6K40_38770 [Okeania sp. SIO3I5]|uniref:hypothetical protein n=1 Tax=Okeania sp. SIO3I5 TaxID=2607805 RepID=UPI0013BAA0F9|nr:hypothetical protein [Okeania sp. SIO3I5]NEQ41807.1 hypothetical protein [Okeania sp. SIO3I5]
MKDTFKMKYRSGKPCAFYHCCDPKWRRYGLIIGELKLNQAHQERGNLTVCLVRTSNGECFWTPCVEELKLSEYGACDWTEIEELRFLPTNFVKPPSCPIDGNYDEF